MTDTRRILVNYMKVPTPDLYKWLDANNIEFMTAPYDDEEVNDPWQQTVGTLVYYLEVYSEEHETAVRLKWDVEE